MSASWTAETLSLYSWRLPFYVVPAANANATKDENMWLEELVWLWVPILGGAGL
jgi:hypothetical protein